MKREIPLFIVDTKKHHHKGECDFVVCTDKENGFVARMDIVENEKPMVTDDVRISELCHNGLRLKMSVLRCTGSNVEPSKVRCLMKKGMEYYIDATQLTFNEENITREQMVDYLDKLIDSNKQWLDTRDYNERMTVATSLLFLHAIKQELVRKD